MPDGQNRGEHHSEHRAHAKAHNADQKARAQTAAVSMCWREILRSPIRSRDSIRRPNTPFLSNPHCSAPLICRTFATVFHSAASKNQPGFLRNLGASFRIRVHRRDRQSEEDDCGAAQNCMLHNHLTTPWNRIDLKFPIFRPSTLLRTKLFRSFFDIKYILRILLQNVLISRNYNHLYQYFSNYNYIF